MQNLRCRIVHSMFYFCRRQCQVLQVYVKFDLKHQIHCYTGFRKRALRVFSSPHHRIRTACYCPNSSSNLTAKSESISQYEISGKSEWFKNCSEQDKALFYVPQRIIANNLTQLPSPIQRDCREWLFKALDKSTSQQQDTEGNVPTADQWQTYYTFVKENLPKMYEEFTPLVFFSYLWRNDKRNWLPSFVDYLTEAGLQTIATSIRSMFALAFHRETYQDQMVNVYNSFLKEASIKDTSVLTDILSCLASTDYWKDALEFVNSDSCQLKQYKKNSSIAMGAIRNGDKDTVLSLFSASYNITNSMIQKLIVACSYGFFTFQEVLEILQKNDCFLNCEAVSEVLRRTRTGSLSEWTAEMAFVSGGHQCSSCGECLPCEQFDTQTIERLRKTLREKILEEFPSVSKELTVFENFLIDRGPFDAIVDGENLLYGHSKRPRLHEMQHAIDVIHQRLDLKTMVVCVRRDMVQVFRSHGHNAVYLVRSHHEKKGLDDLLSIYGTLYSGPSTYIVTSDRMKDHILIMEQDVEFKTWMRCRKIHIEHVYDEIKMPNQIANVPCQRNGVYHFPCWFKRSIVMPYNVVDTVLCVKKSSEIESDE